MNVMAVAFGGMAGALARYFCSIAFVSNRFPTATLTVNIIGSLLIGVVAAVLLKHPDNFWKLLLVTGFCGGFTTFSAFSLETFQLIEQHQNGKALLYIFLSVVGSIAATFAGIIITKKIIC